MLRLSAGILLLSVSVSALACGDVPRHDDAYVGHDSEIASPSEDPITERMAPVDSATIAAHERTMQMAREQNLADLPMGELVQLLAEDFLGAPYVEHLLDQGEEERLVVSLTGFDCVLYNEAVLALARAIKTGNHDFNAFAANIESLRYRDGEMRDYCSRLHYYSDWLYENDRRGNVSLVTGDLIAARPFEKRINFMTEHRDAYRLLAEDEQFACIGDVQTELNQRSLTFVPQDRLREVYDQLQAGDMLALTTDIGGLDVAHTGFVYKFDDGRTGFIHASTTGEVRREADLATYVQGIRRQTGVMVARPVDPGTADR